LRHNVSLHLRRGRASVGRGSGLANKVWPKGITHSGDIQRVDKWKRMLTMTAPIASMRNATRHFNSPGVCGSPKDWQIPMTSREPEKRPLNESDLLIAAVLTMTRATLMPPAIRMVFNPYSHLS